MAWGRQIGVAMTPDDEERFLAFVRGTAPVQILVTPAPTTESIFIDRLPVPTARRPGVFQLWNQDFGWEPRPALTMINTYYLPDIGSAPVIEYCRDSPGMRGRLYWSKGLTPGGAFTFKSAPYSYDAQAFDRWYEQLARWVRKNGLTRHPQG